jgi:hypothetical protein|tara:strand:- start:614 stop:982 length:369 start_codon:yes stop_codon:yes gene_type:complete
MTDIIKYDKSNTPEELWANDLVKTEEVNFSGWQCGIGLESFDIKSNGDIYRGTCHVGGKIGHIDDEVWDLPKDFVECNKRKCTCVADLKTTRYKNNEVRIILQEVVKQTVFEKGGNADSYNF